MILAQIENGVVVNIIIADTRFGIWSDWPEAGNAGIGWSFDGQKFTPPADLETMVSP